MPKPGMRWRHVIISTLNSWLPGDPRGFRSKRHKVHSSGDYKNPPPPGEHAGLHAHAKRISGKPVRIPEELRPVAGKAILAKLRKLDLRVVAIAVAGMHTHLLAELPNDRKKIRHIIGQCKTVSSHKLRRRLPGRVWAGGGKFKKVDAREYQLRVYRYILRQKNAWIWSIEQEQAEQARRLEDSPSGLGVEIDAPKTSAPKPRGESSSPADSTQKKPK